MSIVLGLLNGFVSKKFSHGEEVYTIHDSMTSEGIAERMEGNPSASQLSLVDQNDKSMSQSATISLGEPFPNRYRTLLEHRYDFRRQWHQALVSVLGVHCGRISSPTSLCVV